MKKLITLLLVLNTILGYSQTPDEIKETTYPRYVEWFDKHGSDVEREFVRLLDSARNEVTTPNRYGYNTKEKEYTKRELKRLQKVENKKGNSAWLYPIGYKDIYHFLSVVRNERVPNIKYDSLMSLGCAHHNRYLSNTYGIKYDTTLVSITRGKPELYATIFCHPIGHSEIPNWDGMEYYGKDTLINKFFDRVSYYAPDRNALCEVVLGGPLTYYYKCGDDINGAAKFLIERFKNSPKHWEVLMAPTKYTLCGIDFSYMKNTPDGYSYVTVVLGVIENDLTYK